MAFSFDIFTGSFNEAFHFVFRLLPILIPLTIVQLTLMVTSIVSLVRKPNPWGDKILWLLLILLVNLIGPIIYFAVGSNHLEQKNAEGEDMGDER
jgi:formate/nitrite transporter FocA (FNT family)